MGLKLFVDDVRSCPLGWTPARSVTEAIRILATQVVDEVSLDHDISFESYVHLDNGDVHKLSVKGIPSPETFEAVAYYLASMQESWDISECEASGRPWQVKVRIHTSNFEAGKRMAEIMGIGYTPYIYNEADYK